MVVKKTPKKIRQHCYSFTKMVSSVLIQNILPTTRQKVLPEKLNYNYG